MKAKILAATALLFSVAIAPAVYAEDVVVVPGEVETYVREQPFDDTVTMEGDVVVGQSLPDSVVIRDIPDNDDYAYTVVNKRRVIVEPSTRKVIRVYD